MSARSEAVADTQVGPAVSDALRLEAVELSYRTGSSTTVALDGVDFVVRRGEFVSLVGPSGAGKSSLLHVAGGLLSPDAGRVLVDGNEVVSLGRRERARLRRRHIGFVFQFFHLLPTLTVAENVALPLLFDGRRRRPAVEAARRGLERVGLADKQSLSPGALSGGEMQRVAIARALVTEPRLILADEPTGNLDSRNGSAVLDLLSECVRETGAALLMVTHDREASARADRTVTLRDGHLT